MTDKLSGEAFYKNGLTDVCQWNKPEEATWEHLLANSTVKQTLGLHNEWDEREDADGNVFYVRDSEKLRIHLNELNRFVNVYFEHRSIEKDEKDKTKKKMPRFGDDPVAVVVADANPADMKKPADKALDEMTDEAAAEWLKVK
jgi:hypothetical protein